MKICIVNSKLVNGPHKQLINDTVIYSPNLVSDQIPKLLQNDGGGGGDSSKMSQVGWCGEGSTLHAV